MIYEISGFDIQSNSRERIAIRDTKEEAVKFAQDFIWFPSRFRNIAIVKINNNRRTFIRWIVK